MPCISGQYDPVVGVLLQVAVLPGGHLNKAIQSNSDESPIGVMGAPVSGLLDTGADHTCVSRRLAQSPNLRPSGKIPVSGATGASEMNQYMIDLLLQFGQNSIAITEHMVTEFTSDSTTAYDMLVGRDIICQGVLTMDFSGRFSFSI